MGMIELAKTLFLERGILLFYSFKQFYSLERFSLSEMKLFSRCSLLELVAFL